MLHGLVVNKHYFLPVCMCHFIPCISTSQNISSHIGSELPPSGLSGGAIAGIVIAVVVVVLFISFFVGKDHWKKRNQYPCWQKITGPYRWCKEHSGSQSRSTRSITTTNTSAEIALAETPRARADSEVSYLWSKCVVSPKVRLRWWALHVRYSRGDTQFKTLDNSVNLKSPREYFSIMAPLWLPETWALQRRVQKLRWGVLITH